MIVIARFWNKTWEISVVRPHPDMLPVVMVRHCEIPYDKYRDSVVCGSLADAMDDYRRITEQIEKGEFRKDFRG
jgi:hypothetical protein